MIISIFRSRRKASKVKKRKRIRPCLSVCQTVEQKCPYLLPGDRAPSYPTQYAGEPTFLCLGKYSYHHYSHYNYRNIFVLLVFGTNNNQQHND